jgi:hypothetical protein
MDSKTMLIAAGVIGATILLLVFSRRNAIAGGAYSGMNGEDAIGMDGMEQDTADCTEPCDIAQNEMACVECQLGPEDSACYAECNIAQNPVACTGCIDSLDYIPAWLEDEYFPMGEPAY